MDNSPASEPLQFAGHKRRRQSTATAGSPREVGRMRMRRDTGSSSFVGSGSGIHFLRTVQNAFSRFRDASQDQSGVDEAVDNELVPGEDDRLDGQDPVSLWRSGEISLEGGNLHASNRNIGFDDLVRWSRPYFDSWHPPFPFLHAPTILGLFETISMGGFESLNHADSVSVRSIMSVSLADRRQIPKEHGTLLPSYLAFQTINDALSALNSIIIRPSSLNSLQAVISIQIFLISMLRLNTASRVGGLIVRMLFHLGLHRCPSRFGQFTAKEVDIRRRVFWSVYCLERYLSQSLGLPLDLKDDDLDVCYAEDERHEIPGKRRNDQSQDQSTEAHRLSLSTFFAKHERIKGLILELRNKSILHSHADPDEVIHVDAEISRWWNEAQDLINLPYLDNDGSLESHGRTTTSLTSPPVNLKSSHQLLLIVQKHESVLLFNRPVIASGLDTPACAAALQKCIGASKALILQIYRHLSNEMKAEGAQDGKVYNPLFWPGFVWVVWQSGLILLYAASEGHYSIKAAQREANCCVLILENLSLRGNFWPGACASTIRELQSTLRSKNKHNDKSDSRDWNSSRSFRSPEVGQASATPIYNNENGIGQPEMATVQVNAITTLERDTLDLSSSAGSLRSEGTPVLAQTGQPLGDISKQSACSTQNRNTGSIRRRLPQHVPGNRESSRRPGPSSMPHGELPTLDIASSAFYGELSGQNLEFQPGFNTIESRRGDISSDFENIFQLMDAPYLLSEQMMDPQPQSMEIPWYQTNASHNRSYFQADYSESDKL